MADTVGKDGFEPPNSEEGRFTVCCRWPLGYLPRSENLQFEISNCKMFPSHLSESNQRPTDYKSVALPSELKWQIKSYSSCTLSRHPRTCPTTNRNALPAERSGIFYQLNVRLGSSYSG